MNKAIKIALSNPTHVLIVSAYIGLRIVKPVEDWLLHKIALYGVVSVIVVITDYLAGRPLSRHLTVNVNRTFKWGFTIGFSVVFICFALLAGKIVFGERTSEAIIGIWIGLSLCWYILRAIVDAFFEVSVNQPKAPDKVGYGSS